MVRITIKDIAAKAGVSPSAVSFTLNNRPGVSDSTRERILKVAAELNWQPSSMARALSVSRTNTIGLVINRNQDSLTSEGFYFDFIVGVEAALAEKDMYLTLSIAHSVEDECRIYRNWHAQRRVDAVVVVDPYEGDERPKLLHKLGIPFVYTGEKTDLGASVLGDDSGMIRQIVEHLSSQGCHNLVYVSGPKTLLHVSRRISSFLSACEGAQLQARVLNADEYVTDLGFELTARAYEETPMDGVIYDNESLMIGGYLNLTKRNISIGDDICVVSCEDSPICELQRVPVTAVEGNPQNLGRKAAEILINLLTEKAETVAVLKTSPLIIRKSSLRMSHTETPQT